jgi:hypothetical protein
VGWDMFIRDWLSPPIVAAIGIAATAAAPVLATALSGGVLLGVGGGVFAAGIASAARDPRVAAAWAAFGARVRSTFEGFGVAFREPLIRAASTFGASVERLGPVFKRMSDASAPLVDRLVPALATMMERIMPGLEKAFKASLPLFGTLADYAPKLGGAISKFFEAVAKNGPATNVFLKDLLGFLVWVIPKIGSSLVWLSDRYLEWRNSIVVAVGQARTIWAAFSSWFSGTIVASINRAVEQAKAAWKALRDTAVAAWTGLRDGVNAGWVFLRDRVFNPVKTFITVTIPAAFRSGVDAIGRAWARVRELAAAPIRFVIETVVNRGVIGTFNRVSGFFGGPKVAPVPMPSGLGDGPGLPGGAAHDHDDRARGDGLGDILGLLKGPATWVRNRIGGSIGDIVGRFGNNPFAQLLKGMGGKLLSGLVDKVKSLASSFDFGGGGTGAGGLQAGILAVLGSLRRVFGSVRLISGLRRNARTLSGALSYHALGRAIDIPPVKAWAQFLATAYGARLRELITPWQEFNRHNGRRHAYTGAVWNQHNFAGGNAHIHAAMDRGGYLMPGWNPPLYNGTGRPEPVIPAQTLDQLQQPITVNLYNAVVASERACEDMVVKAVTSAKRKRRI